jgi:HAMP domain-containing protein
MATLIAFELGTLIFSINTLSSVAAYVNAESLWSKSQNEAVYRLLQYSRSFNEADYQKFKQLMKVPAGAHKAFGEMTKDNPDYTVAIQGFIESRNHQDDVEGMVNLFTRFNSISYINKAISIWEQADSLVIEYIPISEQLHNEITSQNRSLERINQIINAIEPINSKLSRLTDEFSYTLREGSRWLENLVLKLLFALALSVEVTGLTFAIVVSRNIQKGLNEILQSAKAVGKKDFSRKARVYSNDEIGVLATKFNDMIDELERSINENENAFKETLRLIKDNNRT